MEETLQTPNEEPKTSRKPSRSPEELIAKLKADGVRFELCGEEDAADYLRHANNYLRTASYRRLFPRQTEGEHAGKYVDLDFAYLRDLSSIDRQLREVLRDITIDIEHFAHMRIQKCAELEGEDGYAIIEDYLASIGHERRSRLLGSMRRRAEEGDLHDTFTGDLIAHYRDAGYPLWVFLEVVEFGTFNDLWLFCARRWADETMEREHYVLKSVKAMRNASMHNNCVVNGFLPPCEGAQAELPRFVLDSLTEGGLKNTRNRRAKLRCLRMAQIATTLWAHDRFCELGGTRVRNAAKLQALRERFESTQHLHARNNALVSYFDFVWKIVDIWAPARP